MCWMILRQIIKLFWRVSGVGLAFRASVCLLKRSIISRGGIQSSIGAFTDSGLGVFTGDIFIIHLREKGRLWGYISRAGKIFPRHCPNPNFAPVFGFTHHPSITTSSPSSKNNTPSFFSSDSSFFGSVRSIRHAIPSFSPLALIRLFR